MSDISIQSNSNKALQDIQTLLDRMEGAPEIEPTGGRPEPKKPLTLGVSEGWAMIEAQNCVVDRFSKSGWAEGPATLVHGKTTFRGKGVYFSSPEAYVKVFEGADVDSQDLKFGGAL